MGFPGIQHQTLHNVLQPEMILYPHGKIWAKSSSNQSMGIINSNRTEIGL
jgi:hypothetical protein